LELWKPKTWPIPCTCFFSPPTTKKTNQLLILNNFKSLYLKHG
jgi:hypothetical protein